MKSKLSMALAWFLRRLVSLSGRIIYRLHIHGKQHIPQKGGVLIVANHVSYLDFMIIVSSIPRYVSFVMNADIYNKPGLKWLLQGLNCIPISPRGGNNNFDAFNNAVAEQLNAGRVVAIFAEGTVSRTGQVLEFKKGISHLSGLTEAPVIAVHLHNVQGTPFSFRAGRNKMEKFRFKNLRREVIVNIGTPGNGKVTAFELRQKIREMETDNFYRMISKSKSLDILLNDAIFKSEIGHWQIGKKQIPFHTLKQKLAEISAVLKPLLNDDDRVALILPKNPESFILNLWIILNNKTVINIDPDFTNEERFYVMKKAGVKTLITTIDLKFSRYSPNAERIIYTEHLHEAIEKGQKLTVICKRIGQISNKVRTAFRPAKGIDQTACIIFSRSEKEEIKCVSLSQRNLLSVISGLKQVYFFERGACMMSNLPLHNAYGYVVEFLLPLLQDLKVDIVDEKSSGDEFIERLVEIKPSLVIASPSQLSNIASLSKVRNIPFLTSIFTADLHPDHQHIRLLCDRGINVFVCAGMNRTTSVFAINMHNYSGKDIAGKIMQQENNLENTIGKPLPGVAAKICNDEHHEQQEDSTGWLWLKGGAIAQLTETEAPCQRTLVHGWLNTGKRAFIDSKGFIHLAEKMS